MNWWGDFKTEISPLFWVVLDSPLIPGPKSIWNKDLIGPCWIVGDCIPSMFGIKFNHFACSWKFDPIKALHGTTPNIELWLSMLKVSKIDKCWKHHDSVICFPNKGANQMNTSNVKIMDTPIYQCSWQWSPLKHGPKDVRTPIWLLQTTSTQRRVLEILRQQPYYIICMQPFVLCFGFEPTKRSFTMKTRVKGFPGG